MLRIMACQHFMKPCNLFSCLYHQACLLLVQYVLLYLERTICMYFFYSHSHGQNGLSSSDGASTLITFSNLDVLVAYLYAFYDSMKLDTTYTNLQFDLLPINVKKSEENQSYKDQMESHIEAYFNDQRLRQANKTQKNVRSMSNNVPIRSINEAKEASGANTKNLNHRTEYYKRYKRNSRQNQALRAKERIKERGTKQSVRKDHSFKAKEREAKQSVRKDPVFRIKERTKERETKQSVRKDPVFRIKERIKERATKQYVRKDASYKAKEREAKQSVRKDPVFRIK